MRVHVEFDAEVEEPFTEYSHPSSRFKHARTRDHHFLLSVPADAVVTKIKAPLPTEDGLYYSARSATHYTLLKGVWYALDAACNPSKWLTFRDGNLPYDDDLEEICK